MGIVELSLLTMERPGKGINTENSQERKKRGGRERRKVKASEPMARSSAHRGLEGPEGTGRSERGYTHSAGVPGRVGEGPCAHLNEDSY